jgi:hypothetical protein
MSTATADRPDPDTLLAHVRLLRLTDKLLDVAEELRDARDELTSRLAMPARGGRSQEGHAGG